MTHEIVQASLQAPEEIRVRRLGDIGNRAIGQNQVDADDGVNDKTILVSLVRVPYPRLVSVQNAGEPPGTNLRLAASHQRRPVA